MIAVSPIMATSTASPIYLKCPRGEILTGLLRVGAPRLRPEYEALRLV
jgi:hypothetical protein